MISKGKSVAGNAILIDYILSDKEKGDALILSQNGIIGTNGTEIMNDFRMFQSNNDVCRKNCISIVISPSLERSFTNEEMKVIGEEHLRQLGLKDHQYLMTLHTSTGKPHIHIVANRIDEKGKAFSDSYISLKLQKISKKIDEQLGLKTAEEIGKKQQSSLKDRFRSSYDIVTSFSLNVYSFDDFIHKMRNYGFIITPTINKKGELQGMKVVDFQYNKREYKMSEIDREIGVKSLIKEGISFAGYKLSSPLQKIMDEALAEREQRRMQKEKAEQERRKEIEKASALQVKIEETKKKPVVSQVKVEREEIIEEKKKQGFKIGR